ncbi:MAG: hypothetical protein AAF296_12465, partial [Pseudomonadota bacterium]
DRFLGLPMMAGGCVGDRLDIWSLFHAPQGSTVGSITQSLGWAEKKRYPFFWKHEWEMGSTVSASAAVESVMERAGL